MPDTKRVRLASTPDISLGFRYKAPEVNSPEKTPLLLLHGFTGCAETMSQLGDSQYDRPTICLDLLGHGASDSPDDPQLYSFAAHTQQLLDFLAASKIAHLHLLGYSMGGRIALVLANALRQQPQVQLESLTLISTSPGLQSQKERAGRIKSDQDLIDLIQTEGLQSFVEKWMDLPIFANQSVLGSEFRKKSYDQRMRCTPTGLMNSLQGVGLGTMPSLWEELEKLEAPCLIITGAKDEKFTALGLQMQKSLKRGILVTIPELGHTPHLEKPELVGKLLLSFLNHTENLKGKHQ